MISVDKYTKKPIYFLFASLGCILVSFLSLLSIIFISYDLSGNNELLSGFIGALFWSSFVLHIILFMLSCKESKNIGIMNGSSGKKLITYFHSPESLTVDIITAVSFIMIMIYILLNIKSSIVVIPTAAMFFLSLDLHYIFNSKNYNALRNKCIKRSVKNET